MLEKSSPEAPLGQSFARPAVAADPIALAKRDCNKALPRRFYKEVTVQQRDGAFMLLLDGRAAKSPGGNSLVLPALAAARAMADEWSAQGETIDPSAMPLTRIVNSAIDGVACRLDATADRHHKICRGGPCLLSRGRAKHADRGASHRLGSGPCVRARKSRSLLHPRRRRSVCRTAGACPRGCARGCP